MASQGFAEHLTNIIAFYLHKISGRDGSWHLRRKWARPGRKRREAGEARTRRPSGRERGGCLPSAARRSPTRAARPQRSFRALPSGGSGAGSGCGAGSRCGLGRPGQRSHHFEGCNGCSLPPDAFSTGHGADPAPLGPLGSGCSLTVPPWRRTRPPGISAKKTAGSPRAGRAGGLRTHAFPAERPGPSVPQGLPCSPRPAGSSQRPPRPAPARMQGLLPGSYLPIRCSPCWTSAAAGGGPHSGPASLSGSSLGWVLGSRPRGERAPDSPRRAGPGLPAESGPRTPRGERAPDSPRRAGPGLPAESGPRTPRGERAPDSPRRAGPGLPAESGPRTPRGERAPDSPRRAGPGLPAESGPRTRQPRAQRRQRRWLLTPRPIKKPPAAPSLLRRVRKRGLA
ncbi:uncharacterized protein ACOB8E_009990 [Sarcophilus harrisii]